MSIYELAEQMMTKQAKENPFMALMPGMEPLQKTTELWMRGMGLPVQSKDGSSVPEVEANLEAAVNAMPGFENYPNLSVHPMAAMAAGTAMSMGAASQAMGTMFGAMAGMMENAAKLQKATTDMASMDVVSPSSFDAALGFAQAPAKRAKSAPKPKAVPAAKPKPVPAAKIAEAAPVPAVAKKPALKTVATTAKKASAKTAAKAVPTKPAPAKVETKSKPKMAPAAEPVATAMPARPGGVAPAAILPEDFKQPKKMRKPGAPDDLKRISGVGPKLERVLNGLGIWTFKQITNLTPNEVAWLDDYLQFGGRIERDDWIAQAGVLAKDKQPA